MFKLLSCIKWAIFSSKYINFRHKIYVTKVREHGKIQLKRMRYSNLKV